MNLQRLAFIKRELRKDPPGPPVIDRHEDSWVHPTAVIGSEGVGYEIDPDLDAKFFMPQRAGVVIKRGARIYAQAQVQRGAMHDTIIGEEVTVGPQVIVGHGCRLERNCTVLGGARLKGSLVIGEGAVVGMGAVVTHDVPAGEIWAGNPARRIR